MIVKVYTYLYIVGSIRSTRTNGVLTLDSSMADNYKLSATASLAATHASVVPPQGDHTETYRALGQDAQSDLGK